MLGQLCEFEHVCVHACTTGVCLCIIIRLAPHRTSCRSDVVTQETLAVLTVTVHTGFLALQTAAVSLPHFAVCVGKHTMSQQQHTMQLPLRSSCSICAHQSSVACTVVLLASARLPFVLSCGVLSEKDLAADNAAAAPIVCEHCSCRLAAPAVVTVHM